MKKVLFPPWEQGHDGRWFRRWTVRIEGARAQPLADALGGPLLEVDATLDPVSGIVQARTVARGDPMSDEVFYWASYEFLQRIDATVGFVMEVQGQPRDWWQPFRKP